MRRECREHFPHHRGYSLPDMHHGMRMMHVPWCMPGSLTSCYLWNRWQGKCYRHYRRMRNPQFYVSGKRPIAQMEFCCFLYCPSSFVCRVMEAHLLGQFWMTRGQEMSRDVQNKDVFLLPSNLLYRLHQIPKLNNFSSRLAVVFAQAIEARC